MSANLDLPLWVQDRREVLKNNDGVEWHGDKRPNYLTTDAHLEKEILLCRKFFGVDAYGGDRNRSQFALNF